MSDEYAPPAAREPGAMGVLGSYRVFAVFMVLVYVALGVALVFWRASSLEAALAIALAALYAVAIFVPREPWAWTLRLVTLVVAIGSIGIVFAIPLLIAWLRPTTKAAYRRLP